MADNKFNELLVSVYGNEVSTDIINSMISYCKKLTNLTVDELKEFLVMCKVHNLNPLKREIYAVKFNGTFQIFTNYFEYLKRADKTGLLDGYRIEIEEENGKIIRGKFFGKRKDMSIEFVKVFDFNEWNQNFGIWKTKPRFMFEKVIVANCLRWMFPNDLGNMPYIQEENWINEEQPKIKLTQPEEVELTEEQKELISNGFK